MPANNSFKLPSLPPQKSKPKVDENKNENEKDNSRELFENDLKDVSRRFNFYTRFVYFGSQESSQTLLAGKNVAPRFTKFETMKFSTNDGDGLRGRGWEEGERTKEKADTPVHTGHIGKETRNCTTNPAHTKDTCGSGPPSEQMPDGCQEQLIRGPKGDKQPDSGRWQMVPPIRGRRGGKSRHGG